jgi:hypothetical protein
MDNCGRSVGIVRLQTTSHGVLVWIITHLTQDSYQWLIKRLKLGLKYQDNHKELQSHAAIQVCWYKWGSLPKSVFDTGGIHRRWVPRQKVDV